MSKRELPYIDINDLRSSLEAVLDTLCENGDLVTWILMWAGDADSDE